LGGWSATKWSAGGPGGSWTPQAGRPRSGKARRRCVGLPTEGGPCASGRSPARAGGRSSPGSSRAAWSGPRALGPLRRGSACGTGSRSLWRSRFAGTPMPQTRRSARAQGAPRVSVRPCSPPSGPPCLLPGTAGGKGRASLRRCHACVRNVTHVSGTICQLCLRNAQGVPHGSPSDP